MIVFELKAFQQLSPLQLYNIIRLRAEVFIVEQNCAYLDPDGKDIQCLHLMGSHENELVAYARIVPPQISYSEPSIGRVVTSVKHRGCGYGRMLMQKAIEVTESKFMKVPIRIGAQQYLKKFYESFGFVQQDEPYMEDGIPHIIMLR